MNTCTSNHSFLPRSLWWATALAAIVLCLPAAARAQDITTTPTPQPAPAPAASTGVESPTVSSSATDDVLVSEDFRDPGSGWPNALVFDNYYVGYHEPEYYHVEVHAPNDHAMAVLPNATFGDVTVETETFADAANTSPEGDFRLGLVVRREGNRYYAFAVSPRTQKWYMLKSASNSMAVLDEGSAASILQDGTANKLRVDAAGSRLSFYINDELVGEAEDGDYSQGAVGFYVETLDSPRAHIHFDNLLVEKYQGSGSLLASEDFRDPGSGWPNALVFDNYYVGYHEPEYYHVEVHAPNDHAMAVLPNATFGDVTVETETFADAANTSPEGDFRLGLVVRREGNRYYAFAVSPRTQKWYMLKSASNSMAVLDEGSAASILQDGTANKLRVDAAGSRLSFYINDELVGEAEDGDYSQGAVGFYVETLDSPRAHIHFDNLLVEKPQLAGGTCEVLVARLNVRSGPSVAYEPLGVVKAGDKLLPMARNQATSWVRVQVVGTMLSGWVSAKPSYYIRCERPLQPLPAEAAAAAN